MGGKRGTVKGAKGEVMVAKVGGLWVGKGGGLRVGKAGVLWWVEGGG